MQDVIRVHPRCIHILVTIKFIQNGIDVGWPALFDGEVDAVIPDSLVIVFDRRDVASDEFGHVHFTQLANVAERGVSLYRFEINH